VHFRVLADLVYLQMTFQLLWALINVIFISDPKVPSQELEIKNKKKLY
jgi:hypothetical protein